MKRFLVFAGAGYYPNGGWDDLKGSTDTLDEATTLALSKAADVKKEQPGDGWWWQIVDMQTEQIVAYDDDSKMAQRTQRT